MARGTPMGSPPTPGGNRSVGFDDAEDESYGGSERPSSGSSRGEEVHMRTEAPGHLNRRVTGATVTHTSSRNLHSREGMRGTTPPRMPRGTTPVNYGHGSSNYGEGHHEGEDRHW